MPDSESPQKFPIPGLELPKDLSPELTKDRQDAKFDKQLGIQTALKRQSIAFDSEEALSPISKQRLQKAIMDENSRVLPNDSNFAEVWVVERTKELHKAVAKGKNAESSTCGYSESVDSWSVKEGTKQDLRYALVRIAFHGCSTAKTDECCSDKDFREVWSGCHVVQGPRCLGQTLDLGLEGKMIRL